LQIPANVKGSSPSIDCEFDFAISPAMQDRLHEQPFSNADCSSSGCDTTHIATAVQRMLANFPEPKRNQDTGCEWSHPTLQEPTMPFASSIKKSSFVVAAVGFAVYGLATTPAAALPLSGLLHPNKPVELGKMPMPNPSKPVPSGPIVNSHPPIDICPLYKPECKGPPKANPNPTPPSGGHGPVVINPPPVIIAPPPVVVAAPPAVIARPVPVYAPHPMPMPAQAPSMSASPHAAAAPSCNCLTKQYLQDGSVLFRDVCTHEAAMATQADLRAQQAAAQNPSQNPSPSANQDQPQATPAR
jgi:hypothetical protein